MPDECMASGAAAADVEQEVPLTAKSANYALSCVLSEDML